MEKNISLKWFLFKQVSNLDSNKSFSNKNIADVQK